MIIKSLTLINFKNHEYKYFEFKNTNHFFGDNFSGKTTIGDAIAFVIYGVTKHGYKLHTSEYVQVGKSFMEVQIEIEKDNQTYLIKRNRNSGKNNLVMNHSVSKDSKIETIFGDTDTFLYSFFLDTFPTLDKKEAREYVIKLLNQSCTISNNASFNELEKELTKIRKADKDRKKRISFYQGQLNVLNEQIANVALHKDGDDNQEKHIELQGQINELSTVIGGLKQQIEQLRAEEIELKHSAIVSPAFEIGDRCPTCKQMMFSKQLHLIEEGKIKNNEAFANKIRQTALEITEIEQTLYLKNSEWTKLKNELTSFPPSHSSTPIELVKQWEDQVKEINTKLSTLEKETLENKHKSRLLKEAIADLASNYQTVVNERLKRSSIRLFQTLKNGDLRPDFQLTYDHKPYRILSTSEEMRCMLEIRQLVSQLSDTKFPIFIDNLESITHLDPPETQIITASVRKGSELTLYSKNA